MSEHLGPKDDPKEVWDLPPVTVGGQQFGPRHRPVNDIADPGGWVPGEPYGEKAWRISRS